MMAVLAAMFAFVACETTTPDEPVKPNEGSKLATPELSVEKTETSFTVKWNAVTNAESYNVKLQGDSKTNNTTECQFTFSNLNAGTYVVRVQALADGYKNSDAASISVDIDGLSEADWFDLTLELLEEPYVTEKYTFTSFNSVVVAMSGEGVSTVFYAVFDTPSIEGVSKAEIKKFVKEKGNAVSVDGIQDINNPEKDFATIVGGCVGSTEYTCFAVVTNADGLEAMVSATITTGYAEATAEAKAWFGEWSAYVEKTFHYGADKNDVNKWFKEERVDLDLTIEQYEGYPDVLRVYGLTLFDESLPAIAYVYKGENGENMLGIMNEQVITINEADNMYLTWFAFGLYTSNGQSQYTFMPNEFPVHMFTMGEGGTATSTTNSLTFTSGATFDPLAFGIIGWDGNEGLSVYQDGETKQAIPMYAGDIMGITKKSATPETQARTAKRAYTSSIPASLVFAE